MSDDWAIRWNGREWRRSDVTAEHLRIIAELTGVDSWTSIDLDDLHPAYGPLRVLALIVAFTCVDERVRGRTAVLRVVESFASVPADELLAAVRLSVKEQ